MLVRRNHCTVSTVLCLEIQLDRKRQHQFHKLGSTKMDWSTCLLLRTCRCLDGKVSEQVHKLCRLSSVGRQFWPDAPHQIQQSVLLTQRRTPGNNAEENVVIFPVFLCQILPELYHLSRVKNWIPPVRKQTCRCRAQECGPASAPRSSWIRAGNI